MCKFKHHTNVTTCDITSFFNQPWAQPNNTANRNHDMTPDANNNPRTPHHHNQPNNEDNCPQMTLNTHQNQQLPSSRMTASTMNGHRWWHVKVSKLTSPPPLSSLTWDAGATIAISDMAMKQWTMTKNCCLLLLLGHHSKSLGSSQTTWIRHSMTTDWWHGQDRDNNDDTAQRRGCPMTPMWNEEMTRTHNNDMQLGNDNMRKDDDKGPGPPTNSDDFPSPSPSPSPSPFPSPSPSLHHLPSLHPPSLHPPSPQHPPSLLHPPSPLHLPSL